MQATPHKGVGRLDLNGGVIEIIYVLTVARSASAEDGYGHIQAKGLQFEPLVADDRPLNLVLEARGRVQILLTTCAGERAVFSTTGSIPDFLFERAI